MNALNIGFEHLIFIPSIFFLGWVVGFLMGASRQSRANESDATDS